MRNITIKLHGLELEVDFYYHPTEGPSMEGPGCEEEFEICDVFISGTNRTHRITELFDNDDLREELERTIRGNHGL